VIRQELLSILACPVCSSPSLRYVNSDGDPAILCDDCGERYGFKYNIPLMYKDDEFWAPKKREAEGWVAMFKELGFYDPPSFIPDLPFIPEEPWATIARVFKAALSQMNLRGGERVLDLGAGEGWAAQRFTERGCHAVAIDVVCDPNMGLSQSWKRMEYSGAVYDLVIGDNERLPFQPGTFDFVFASAALHHCNNLNDLMCNVFRVLRPGGRLIAVGEPITSIFQQESDAHDGDREKAHGIIERRRRFYHYLLAMWRAGFRNIHAEDDQTFWKTNAELYPWLDQQRYAISRRPLLGTTAVTKLLTYLMLRLPRPFAVALLLNLRDQGLLLISGQKPA